MKSKFTVYSFFLMVFVLAFASSCIKEDPDDNLITYSIGQLYGGGIIFYLDETGQHGLICAPVDQSTAIQWSNGSDIITNATGSVIGTGLANTEAIIAAQGPGSYAAQICYDLVLGGYSDWFLPSKSECGTMYFNLEIFNNFGYLTDALYWSSTEASIGNAYSQYSNDGYPPNGGYYKSSANYVRAVRAF
jgi:hypothetical protein